MNTVLAACAAAWARWAARLEVVWLAILVAPAFSAVSMSTQWDFDGYRIVMASCWLIACLRALLSRRAYFVASLAESPSPA